VSLLNRTEDAIVYLAREEGDDVVTFAEATLRRDYVNGCSTSPVGFLEGVYVNRLIVTAGLLRYYVRRSKIGRLT
jgi:aminoglycoside 6'-N-acetyltransferase I